MEHDKFIIVIYCADKHVSRMRRASRLMRQQGHDAHVLGETDARQVFCEGPRLHSRPVVHVICGKQSLPPRAAIEFRRALSDRVGPWDAVIVVRGNPDRPLSLAAEVYRACGILAEVGRRQMLTAN